MSLPRIGDAGGTTYGSPNHHITPCGKENWTHSAARGSSYIYGASMISFVESSSLCTFNNMTAYFFGFMFTELMNKTCTVLKLHSGSKEVKCVARIWLYLPHAAKVASSILREHIATAYPVCIWHSIAAYHMWYLFEVNWSASYSWRMKPDSFSGWFWCKIRLFDELLLLYHSPGAQSHTPRLDQS